MNRPQESGRIRSPLARCALAAAGSGVLALCGQSTALAQSGPETPKTPTPIKLGLRMTALRLKVKMRPIVVLVKNEREYVDAVASWRMPGDYFPVLIDDGSDLGRENIARFVRAYLPRAVVRWDPTRGALPLAGAELPDKGGVREMPTDPAQKAERINASLFSAWGSTDVAGMKAGLREIGLDPVGITYASTSDPAWVAALALAAGHGQYLSWLDPQLVGGGQPGDTMAPQQLASLITGIEDGAKQTEAKWDELSDDIDAITLCANAPSKIRGIGSGGIDQTMALTDRLGRKADMSRWSYSGLVFGDAQTAAYRAMCPLFLGVESAWAFDGYEFSQLTGRYNLKPVIEILMGTPVKLAFDPARSSAKDFRGVARGGLESSFVYVNTKGQMWNFEFSPGKLYSFDVPMMNVPAVVHFTHSYSAQVVHHRSSVAGRWLENGAYAYYGSVDEPYLSSFVPGPDFFQRYFVYTAPFACCCRYEIAPLGKLNVYGDPLQMAGPPPIRLEETLPSEGPLAGLKPMADEVKETLKAGKIEQAAAELVMLGRDKDAVRLCLAGLNVKATDGKPAPDRARLGAIGMPAAFRERDPAALATLCVAMPVSMRNDPFYVSLLWQAGRPTLSGDPTPDMLTAMKSAIRELCAFEDLEDLTPAVRKAEGKQGVEGMWKMVIARTDDPKSRKDLEEALREALRK